MSGQMMGSRAWLGLLCGALALGAFGCDDGASQPADPDVGASLDGALPPRPDLRPGRPDMRGPDLAVPGADAALPARCADDAECPAEAYCSAAGICAPGCRPGGCPAGLECAAGICVAPPCLADADCPAGTFCQAGSCEVGCRQAPDDCPAGQRCDARNRCVPDCEGDGCAPPCDGIVDEEGRCQPAPPDRCVPEAPCAAEAPGRCAAGRTRCPEGPAGAPACAVVLAPQAEACNGEDDDCDGAVDEDFPSLGAPCQRGQGSCQVEGALACGADGAGLVCVAEDAPAQAERCDGLDNDCDGAVDEGFPGLGQACAAGLGQCAAQGLLRCGPDGAGPACDVEAGAPAAERCNGLDDDCDGAVDEDFEGLGAACAVGVGGCRAAGRQICAPGGAGLLCDAAPGLPGAEQCDGVDNDCDGIIDEGPGGADLIRPCYTGPAGSAGLGACEAGTQRCARGSFGRCEGQVLPFPEVCDGADRDCDGRVDEGADGGPLAEACYTGPLGTAGIGVCAAGARACVAGGLSDCAGEVLPQREICDGLDNDCNGLVDDVGGEGCACAAGAEQACYSGPPGTAGVGRCLAGTQVCGAEGRFEACAGAVVPAQEQCNGADDDCDGRVDEGLLAVGRACTLGAGGCARNGSLVCAGAAGLRCDAPEVPPLPERCNGEDDDCDGRVDEGFDRGGACTVGVGACARAGFVVCTEEDAAGCSAAPGPAGPELCNGADDDCDGAVDEGLGLGERCADGVAACRVEGVQICGPGGAVVCSARAQEPTPERCDGQDNDCDGAVDEGLGLGEGCLAGDGACLRPGLRRCDGAGGVTCFGGAADGVEQCNGLDDDCDGRVDEGNPQAGEACDTGAPGACAVGEASCFRGALRCFVTTQPAAERCDGLDNDCDGRLDEDFGGAAPCTVGVGACAREGLARCDAAGALVCPVAAGSPGEERCNGLDDDCDGAVDEAAPRAGGFCTRGQGACRADGAVVCAEGALRCDAAVIAPGREVCNGLDDDCDGGVDEGFPVGQICALGQGRCAAEGRFRCTLEGEAACDAPVIAPEAEACSGLDEDCDGRVDEGGVCPDAEPPELSLAWLPPRVDPGVEAVLRVVASDRLGAVASLEVSVDGAPLALDAAGEGRFIPAAPGRIRALAVAVDDSGNEAQAEAWLAVRDPDDLTLPEVEIVAPAEGTRIREETEIRARIVDANFERVVVETSLDGVRFSQVAEGFEAGEDVVVARLDPSLAAPGFLFVRVTAFDLGGNSRWHQVTLQVPDGISVGESKLAVRDFALPLQGLPIIIDRAYDSRRRGEVGPFGHGWRLAREDVVVIEDPQGNVLVALPDGRREVFAVAYDIPPLLPVGSLRFVAPEGVTSRLEAADGCAVVASPTGPLCMFSGRPPVATISDYVLTTAEGRRYELHDTDGLRRLTDAEGNVLSLSAEGITSSAGPGFRFERDAEGRITRITDPSGASMAYRYDAAGDLVAVEDPVGGVQRYRYVDHRLVEVLGPDGQPVVRTEFDAEGRKLREVDALGFAVTYAYDRDGRRAVVTDRRGGITTYDYDAAGRVLRRVDALGDALEYRYDAAGRLAAEDTPAGGALTYTRDALGNPTEIVSPAGTVYEWAYSPLGKPTVYRTPLGAEIALDYDEAGRLVSWRNASGGQALLEYDAAGRRVAEVDALGQRFEYGYDAAGNVIRVAGPDGQGRDYAWDAVGNLVAMTDPEGAVVALEWDAAGRLVRLSDALGHAHAFERDGLGRLTGYTDPLGRRQTWRYDPRGLLAQVSDGLGAPTRYQYDPEGDLESVTDALGRSRAFERDLGGRIVARTDALGGVRRFRYDAADRLVERILETGQETRFEYDALDHLVRQDGGPGADRRFTFDAGGRMVSAALDGFVTTFEYDADDRLVAQTQGGITVEADYDQAGRLVSLRGPDGEVSYEIDSRGRLSQVRDPAGRAIDFSRDPEGRLLRQRLPGGVEVRYEYDPAGKPVAWEISRLGVVLDGATRSFDASGRLVREARHQGPIRSFEYDAAGQLVAETSEDAAGGPLHRLEYGYDPVGNRVSLTGPEGVSRARLDANDRILEREGPGGVIERNEWGADGVLLRRTAGEAPPWELSYDSEQRLVGYAQGAAQTALLRDALGAPRALQQAGRAQALISFLGDPLWALEGGAVVARHVYGDQTDQLLASLSPAGDRYYALDPRGDVVAVFDARGELLRRHLYTGFGEALTDPALGDFAAVPDGDFGFGARPFAAGPGLYDFRARHYDPRAGRFIQPDPLAGDPKLPRTQHAYLYGLNDPLRYRDPTGRVAAIGYAWRAAQFVLGSGTGAPNYYEMMGSLIGFFHGFANTGLVFLANILDIATRGDVLSQWGAAISRTEAKMGEIKHAMGLLEAADHHGFAGAFIGGANLNVGVSFSAQLVPGRAGKVVDWFGGPNPGCKVQLQMTRTVGGFSSGIAEFLNYVGQIAPDPGWSLNAGAGCQ